MPQCRYQRWGKLSHMGFDSLYGARALSSIIQEHVKKPLAEKLLFGALQKGGAVTVGLDALANKLSFEVHAAAGATKAAGEPKENETVKG
jgi:ATP-dependent Clp protease ATP-binding subunit ClpA